MEFGDSVRKVRGGFIAAGYSKAFDRINIMSLPKEHAIDDCRIIATKDQYDVFYLEAKSSWKGSATDVARQHAHPCLVITAYGDSHLILSTIKDVMTNSPKPRHVVIDKRSQAYSMDEFVRLIKADAGDDFISIDKKIQAAFDRFSDYKQAVSEFGENLEVAIKKTRDMIIRKSKNNEDYDAESRRFLTMCRKVISDKLEPGDVTELLVQHVMTYRIFEMLYDGHELHTTNAIARSMEELVKIVTIDPAGVIANYKTIELVAESVTGAEEKQDFLKLVYETFYAKYDPKNKDSWGIAYTPSEVVDFMVRSTDHLLEKHFRKSMSDDCVTILDPATGTGTFVTSILRHLKPDSLDAKYENDIFANDISLLAYYIAALNIENTYQEITEKMREFENICWMDTLATGTKDFGKVDAYFESQDNVKRISKQQTKDICVVMGNPPYNAVRVSFHDANPSNKYPDLDKKIEESYVLASKSQGKIKQYDMYKRFLKWSSERIKDHGMVAFITNNSFLDAKANDGFRKGIVDEFDYIYTINLKGLGRDVTGDEAKREGENIFGNKAMVGIAISFFVKTGENKSVVNYTEVDDYLKCEAKREWLLKNKFSDLGFKQIKPDKKFTWINKTNNDFDELVPVISYTNSIFGIKSVGSMTARDEWVYDFSEASLKQKMEYFVNHYNYVLKKFQKEVPSDIAGWVDKKIKWSDRFFGHLISNTSLTYSDDNIKMALYKPFVLKLQYSDEHVIERPSGLTKIYKNSKPNKMICFPSPVTSIEFHTLVTDKIIQYSCIKNAQCLPLHTYDDAGNRHSNITSFGLKLFRNYYHNDDITDENVFYYIYAIFNDPKYNRKYKYDLRRAFPRIPLAKNFDHWVKIGKKLCEYHIGFLHVKPYPVRRIDGRNNKNQPVLQLKQIDSDSFVKIIIDSQTTLEQIPHSAIQYTLRSKPALKWILDYYKERKNKISTDSCSDPELRKKYTTYAFADYKEHVIDLLQRVITVSIETMRLRSELEKMPWGKQPKLNLEKTKNPKALKKSRTEKKKGAKNAPRKRRSKGGIALDGARQKRLM